MSLYFDTPSFGIFWRRLAAGGSEGLPAAPPGREGLFFYEADAVGICATLAVIININIP